MMKKQNFQRKIYYVIFIQRRFKHLKCIFCKFNTLFLFIFLIKRIKQMLNVCDDVNSEQSTSILSVNEILETLTVFHKCTFRNIYSLLRHHTYYREEMKKK